MATAEACPECAGTKLFSRDVASGGRYGPQLLPGLGAFMQFAKFRVVVCADCGLTRFFAEPSARRKLATSDGWRSQIVCAKCRYDLTGNVSGVCPECGTPTA
jgi:predicted nucleic-acid-binding Zn-ribbon protein